MELLVNGFVGLAIVAFIGFVTFNAVRRSRDRRVTR
jgi:hypothetical protein